MTSVTGGNVGRAGTAAEGAYAGWALAGATIFFGAFFLFQVEPLIAKAILPWFGGSAQVWTTCLLFFQTGLLCGYLYAHLLAERVAPMWQVRIHIALLVLSLAVLPIFPAEFWKPTGDENPLLMILGLLTATIGLPFFLLSATNPLVQSWLARSQSKAPYQLFALSNFGSMLALLSYPVMVEPFLPLRVQTWAWSIGYALFVLLCATTAWRYRSGEKTALIETADAGDAPSWSERGLWFALAALPSAMLLAVTNFLLQNVAAIPLFWILPLALYLMSFIFAFGSLRWYWRPFWYLAGAAAIVAMLVAMSGFTSLNDYRFLPLFTICLFVVCLVCHGEVASLRPKPRYLTSYYLIIAAGGAFGGLFVAAAAPLLLFANFELQIIVPLTAAAIVLAAWWRYRFTKRAGLRDALLMVSLSILSGATSYMAVYTYRDLQGSHLLARNFYGALRVTDLPPLVPGDERRLLLNGSINHGEQFLAPDKRREPITYFSHASGLGVGLTELGKDGPLKVGVIGLGTGTIAAYCRDGDTYRFYEINPLVLQIAQTEFSYLKDCPTGPTVTMGDARLSLEAEQPQQYDFFAVDAFISDAIPVHLLTKEAFDLYWRHLKPDGVLAVHISNRYVDLAPIVATAAEANGKRVRIIANGSDVTQAVSGATWMLVTSRPGFFERPALQSAFDAEIPRGFTGWTDDYSNLWQVFSLRR
jgi:SAM-dependent methyltransferase